MLVIEMGGDQVGYRFERLREQTRKRAYVMALQLTRNPTEAEDLVQDTYLKAWRGFDSYAAGRPFLNWLLRIMQRAYLDGRRRENPIRRADSLEGPATSASGEVQELTIPDYADAPDENVLIKEFQREARLALESLPPLYRDTIMLCDIEEMSYEEIAERHGTTVGTIRSRIHRGRKLLRDIVRERGIELPVRRI
jgi:RNA polymerase sigma-70 factor, ECF subfamily